MKKNMVTQGDCVELFGRVPDGSVDLVFADPPFNIGYDYDVYDDARDADSYLKWSNEWMAQVHRVLKSNGAFWLAIGDEYAAELKVAATRDLGFTCRSWVIWYYTFGVHCTGKFTRSHAHLFHFVKNPKDFVFNDEAVRVPSARQLVYGDKRANPKGRIPDDTWIMAPAPDQSWILRPQEIPDSFSADSDTWYFPRVCGTFKERMGFHGCQMPEQLLGRIIRATSNEGDLVLDPFTGSGTTLAVAKKLGREFLGFELSEQYADEASKRLASIRSGDRLDGSENPLATTPNGKAISRSKTAPSHRKKLQAKRESPTTKRATRETDERAELIEAFVASSDGYSTDRVIADPRLNKLFISECKARGIQGKPVDWNLRLLNLRKASALEHLRGRKRTILSSSVVSECEFASEIAFRMISRESECTLDQLLCDPDLISKFDRITKQIGPTTDSALFFRWAALRLRKRASATRKAGASVRDTYGNSEFTKPCVASGVKLNRVPDQPAIYLLRDGREVLYVGHTVNLRNWLESQQASSAFTEGVIAKESKRDIRMSHLPLQSPDLDIRHGIQSLQIGRHRPPLNYLDLAMPSESH